MEVIGSSTRIPSLARIIEDVFKKPVSRTLNAKECVSRGCALQCAMLSPTFKVRPNIFLLKHKNYVLLFWGT